MLRQSGDIDLFFLESNEYKKAVDELHKYFSVPMTDTDLNGVHALFICKDIVVELHGGIHGAINRKTMKNIMSWTKQIFAQKTPLKCNIDEAKAVLLQCISMLFSSSCMRFDTILEVLLD